MKYIMLGSTLKPPRGVNLRVDPQNAATLIFRFRVKVMPPNSNPKPLENFRVGYYFGGKFEV